MTDKLNTAELGFDQLPHYSTHALEFLDDLAPRLPGIGIDPCFELFLAGCLRESVKFLLPDNGYLFAEHDYKPWMFELQRMPFPMCALEFRAGRDLYAEGSGLIHSEKRIALSFDPHALPGHLQSLFLRSIERTLQDLPANCIAMTSVYSGEATWGAAVGFALMDLSSAPIPVAEVDPARDSGSLGVLAQRVRDAGFVRGKGSVHGLPCDFYIVPQRARLVRQSPDQAYEALYVDSIDEVRATYEFLAAVNCANVGCQVIEAPAKLNAKRARNGKPLFYPYKLLDLVPDQAYRPRAGGASGIEVRKHLRRGHPRHLGPKFGNKVLWINATTVKPWLPGEVGKLYKVRS